MKLILSVFSFKTPLLKSILMMKMVIFLLIASCIQVQAAGQKVSLSKTNAPLKEIFRSIESQSGYLFMYETGLINSRLKATVNISNADINQTMNECLKGTSLSYSIVGKSILLKNKPAKTITEEKSIQEEEEDLANRTITGQVTDTDGKPLVGASVFVKSNEKIGTTTNAEGRFSIFIPADVKILVVNFVGYKSKEITIGEKSNYMVLLEPALAKMDDVVVTGIYTRTKESFTGSSSTFTAKEIKSIGNQNVLQSLRTLDPSFAILDNKLMGSDPNTLPDINIRGKTSVIGLTQEFENDPNQPLFILDGYETTLKTVNDLNIDRVESITILKDAAATAIYGSQSANGVIVIETKRPEAGTFKVSYSLNTSITFADLSDYNLMNSEEKLKFELLSGYYGAIDENNIIISEVEAQRYNQRLAEAKRGVDTYWMNEPLRVAMTQGHNLFADGGDERMRYGLGFTYNKTPGVMKGSDRDAANGSIRLIYRAGKFSFSNNLNLDYSNGVREAVPFSEYSAANPYFRKFDEYGEITRVAEKFTNTVFGSTNYGKEQFVFNPLYNASLNYIDRTPSLGFRNNFDVDWRVASSLRVRGRASLNQTTNKTERFIGPRNSQFESAEALQKGSYTSTVSDAFGYNGDLTVTYGKLFAKKHMLNAVVGIRLNHSSRVNNGFSVIGFQEDAYPNPAFSNGYRTGSKPIYTETERRSTSYYTNFGYSYDNRFMIDGNYRSDGSSLFGVKNQFTSTWATGLAWNIHNEQFMKSMPFITYFKVRASVGNPGNQNFDARMTMNIYDYSLSYQNPFGLSALISGWGNQDLDWQKTLDKNIGVDLEVLDRRLRFNVDYFDKNTDPLLVFVDIPSSTGTSTIPKNLGAQRTKGFTGAVNYQVIKTENSMWSLNANVRKLRMKFKNFGSGLDRYNNENKNRSLQRYYDGGSPTDMWAVRSAGIDPATGREIFIKKDGTQTFVYDFNDEVIVGSSDPKLEGVIGSSYYHKGFSFSMNFRYKIGGQVLLSSLFSKVENLSTNSLKYNQDKRALYDRWQKPGDEAKFKGISLTDNTPMSSRFIADENVFSAESISAGYDFQGSWLKAIGVSGLTMRAYMNQIFRISTVKEERGIGYPFARSVSLSFSARF